VRSPTPDGDPLGRDIAVTAALLRVMVDRATEAALVERALHPGSLTATPSGRSAGL
jgi:hypothetical protein